MNNKTTNSEQLKQAIEFHQQGQLDAASQLYQQILVVEPAHFDALHFSGVIEQQRGNPREAIQLIQQALQTVTTVFTIEHASAFCNLGSALNDIGAYQHGLNNLEIAIELKPNYAIAHNNRGNSLKHLGRIQQAITSYRTALLHQPNYSEAMYNCAVAYQSINEHEQALQQLDQVLVVRPHYAPAHFACGISLQSLQQFSDAIASYQRAIDHQPSYIEAYLNQGIAHNKLGEFEQALSSFNRLIKHAPNNAKGHLYRANSLRYLGHRDEAIAAYQLARQLGAHAPHVDFALAALGVGSAPTAPPQTYITELFDQYADHFDEHLVNVLHYQTPEILAQLIDQYRPEEQLISLDLGCGTGLCANYLRPYSSTLTGVDLSPNMLKQAQALGLYDELVCGEMVGYLKEESAIDLIVAADALVYLGDLSHAFKAAHSALKPGGLLAFSVEEANALIRTDFVLKSSHRYAHTELYLIHLATEIGFDILQINSHFAREENQQPVNALMSIFRRRSSF